MTPGRRGALALFAASLLVMCSFHQEHTTWNVNSRLALTFAIVDRHTFAIDGYVGDNEDLATGDKAVFGGHTYSDKVFGISLLGVPVYWAMQTVAHVGGFEWPLRWKIFVLRVWCASLPAALSLVLLWTMMLREGAAPRQALFAVATAFFGSLWFGYSTLSMPYAAGIAACVAALYLLLYVPDGRISTGRAAAIGLLCGFALICDFTFGLIVGAIGLLALVRLRGPALIGAAIAGALPLLAFFAYTYAIFGRPSIPYEFEASQMFREQMARGVMGVTAPKLAAAWFLTVHPYRGVFFWSSWMLLALAGCVMGTRQSGTRRTWAWLGLWAFGAYLLFNSGYYMWWGGWSMGPRLMLPIMAVVPMGLAEICRPDRSRVWWWALALTATVSIGLCLPLSIIDPQLRQLHDDATLFAATIGTHLQAPQFEYVWRYYSGNWFIGEGGVVHAGHFVPPIAVAAAAMLLWLTANQLLSRGSERQRAPKRDR